MQEIFFYFQRIYAGFGILGVRSHARARLYTLQKKARLVSFKKLQGVRQITRLKQQRFLSFTFYITQKSYAKMCIYLFHWFSGENCIIFIFFTSERQTSKELKRNMNDGTMVFLTSLLIVLTGKILLLICFWYKIISCFK